MTVERRPLPITPEPGCLVLVDGWANGYIATRLLPCEVPEFAPFRLPSVRYDDVSYPVRLKVTGRTLQRRPYSDTSWVRVKIVFVGDGEPDTVGRGWLSA